MATNKPTRIKHVYGNVMKIAIPLTIIIRTLENGEEVETEQDFYPSSNYPVNVILYKGGGLRKSYTATMDGNVALIEDDGTIPIGVYQVEVLCHDDNGNPYRYMVRSIVEITDATIDAGIEAGIEFNSETYTLDGAVFFYAKGDKGDPFTYEDFTPEEIAELQRPAREAAETALEAAATANAEADRAHEEAREADIAAANANTAAQNAKADYVGDDNYVYRWNPSLQAYEETDLYVKGEQGEPGTTDYNELENKPTIPDELSDLQDDTSHRTVTDAEKQAWNEKYKKPNSGIPASDLADGVIPDVSNFITKSVDNLVNYYLKSETYTKSEVQGLLAAIRQFTYEVVQTLPTASASTMHKIYLVPSADPQAENVKDEYITIDNGTDAPTRYTWEQIGSTAIDLSDYYTKSQTDNAITSALNTALASYVTSSALATTLADYYTKAQTDALIENTPDFVEEEPTEELVDEFATLRTNLYQALEDAQQVTSEASDAATLAGTKAGLADAAATLASEKAALADEKAGLANTKAQYADEQGDYAKTQGDYAKEQAEIIENMDWIEFVEDNTDTNPFV